MTGPVVTSWDRHFLRPEETEAVWKFAGRRYATSARCPAAAASRPKAPDWDRWTDPNATMERNSPQTPAFTDRGKEIDIYDSKRPESVLAALQLSAQKWGTFTVRGNERFLKICVELAAEHGFNIANPELQKAIAAERERIHALGRDRPPDRDRCPGEIGETRTAPQVHRRHLGDVTRER
jgi:hypothetical protein